jgi:hypothetical protein
MTQIEQCPKCGKPSGFKGYRGAECQCGVKLGSAIKGAPSVGTRVEVREGVKTTWFADGLGFVCERVEPLKWSAALDPTNWDVEPEAGPEPTGEDT